MWSVRRVDQCHRTLPSFSLFSCRSVSPTTLNPRPPWADVVHPVRPSYIYGYEYADTQACVSKSTRAIRWTTEKRNKIEGHGKKKMLKLEAFLSSGYLTLAIGSEKNWPWTFVFVFWVFSFYFMIHLLITVFTLSSHLHISVLTHFCLRSPVNNYAQWLDIRKSEDYLLYADTHATCALSWTLNNETFRDSKLTNHRYNSSHVSRLEYPVSVATHLAICEMYITLTLRVINTSRTTQNQRTWVFPSYIEKLTLMTVHDLARRGW